MRYVMAKYVEYRQCQAYRIYITDSLFYMGENKRLTKRYAEALQPQKIDNRSGDEIALDVINRLNLKVEEDA